MKEGELYLSKYKILKVYKETLEACVLLAEHIQLNSYWIIKKLNGVNVDTMREVEVLKGVKHPGIPAIFDVIADGDSLVIIREFVEGENLNEYAKNGLSMEEIVTIGLKICGILKFLHEELNRPLIFRDLKPGNIIMTQKGDIKLIDFGIARFYKEDSNQDTTYLGTKGFASPEQYGINQSDVRTDVFGLGATLYFLTTKSDLGKPPYKILPLSNFRNDVDKAFEKILIKACEINKNKRYQSITELEVDLLKLVKTKIKQSWEEKIISLNKRVICVSGLKEGAGTSYTTLRLAQYLSLSHVSVAIVDASESHSLSTLEYQEDTIIKKASIIYKGIQIIDKDQLSKANQEFINEQFKKTDIIMIDLGKFVHSKLLAFSDCLEASDLWNHLIICRISPWEIEAFEEFILSDLYETYQKVIINSCSKEEYIRICNSIEDVNCHYLPYIAYEDISNEDKFAEQVLKEMEVEAQWPKNPNFLNPKYYKTKLLKRIKP